MPSDGIAYPLFALTGLLPWIFFSNGVNLCTNSLVSEANLIKKVYFPRLIVPISSVCSGTLDFLIGFFLLLGLIPFFGHEWNWTLMLMPFFFVLLFITTAGIGIWLSSLNAQFRDVHHTVPFALQIWLFMTPIVYPSSLLSDKWKLIYALNPMVGVVECFRWLVLGNQMTSDVFTTSIYMSAAISILLFATGIIFFRKMEKTLADYV